MVLEVVQPERSVFARVEAARARRERRWMVYILEIGLVWIVKDG
jgi:hypothetical protein